MPSGEPALPTSQPARWSVDELIPFGKYILLNKISAGATAAVYRAKIRGEAGFERLVTIKRVLPQMAGDPDFVETFVREAKICARLTHGNICPIYELGKVGESLYMALEWVAGRDLGSISRRLSHTGKRMQPMAAAFVVSRLCDALDYAHGLKDASGRLLGILHQDLSPANIMISYEGEVKLIDFGIARASGRAQQTNVEALKQKLGYMSPELVLGTALDARSDVFGVGVVLYEMVTGKRLFAGADDIATLKLVSSASVTPPSALLEDTPEELEQIIMRALARDPAARWPSAGEMAHALMACIAAEDPTFGTRNIAELMRDLFQEDMAAEQRRLNALLAASQDAELMERRRRFFASPQGASAVAKAEAARKLASTRPPPPAPSAPPPPRYGRSAAQSAFASGAPAAVSGGKPSPVTLQSNTDDASEEELTTYRDPSHATHAPSTSRASALGGASAGDAAAPKPDDGLTTAATYGELVRGASAEADPEAEPTSFYDDAKPSPQRDSEEPTSFYDDAKHAQPRGAEPTSFQADGKASPQRDSEEPTSFYDDVLKPVPQRGPEQPSFFSSGAAAGSPNAAQNAVTPRAPAPAAQPAANGGAPGKPNERRAAQTGSTASAAESGGSRARTQLGPSALAAPSGAQSTPSLAAQRGAAQTGAQSGVAAGGQLGPSAAGPSSAAGRGAPQPGAESGVAGGAELGPSAGAPSGAAQRGAPQPGPSIGPAHRGGDVRAEPAGAGGARAPRRGTPTLLGTAPAPAGTTNDAASLAAMSGTARAAADAPADAVRRGASARGAAGVAPPPAAGAARQPAGAVGNAASSALGAHRGSGQHDPADAPENEDTQSESLDELTVAAIDADSSELEDDVATFPPEHAAQSTPVPPDRPTLRAPDPEEAPRADAAVAAAYEEEPTSYLSPERKLNPALELAAASHGASPFEEEATHIFFSADEGIGLPEVPDDEPTTVEPPLPLRVAAPGSAAAAAHSGDLQPAPLGGAVRARARVAQKLLKLPAATATGRHLPLTGAQTETAQDNEPNPFRRAGPSFAIPHAQRGPLLWMAAALLLVIITGVLVKTPLGITLGLRKPADGVIEIRTAPEVPASVRLDGIYRGRAPLRLEGVPAGNRILALEAEGYAPVSRLVSLEAGATVQENIKLNPQPKAASQLASP